MATLGFRLGRAGFVFRPRANIAPADQPPDQRRSQSRAGAIAVSCLHRRAAMSGTRDRAGLAPVVYFAQSREKKLMPVGLFRDEEGSVQVNYGTGATIPIPRSRRN